MMKQSSSLDSELDSLIKTCKTRMQKILDGKQKYRRLPVPRSNKFLRNHISEKHSMFVLFIDMVGSTKMSFNLSAEELSLIIRSFCQEVSFVIENYNGYVLKFVGDAVIGYFLSERKSCKDVNRIIACANTIQLIIENCINPTLREHRLPQIQVKIGIDWGEGSIILYSSDKRKAHIDIIGLTLNLAAKMQNLANPNQIVIGNNVYVQLSFPMKKSFKKLQFDTRKWNYDFKGKTYPNYASR